MNKILDNYLCEAYPRIFVERSKSPRESCMGRGFECGNGWFPIINSLCYQIQNHIDNHNKYVKKYDKKGTPIPQFVALQVKEKFGALRIYSQGGDAFCEGVIAFAESISTHFCEICGKGGILFTGRTEGWITTLCEDCSKKLKKKAKPRKELKPLLARAVKQDLKKYV
jgi:hypothetical protein